MTPEEQANLEVARRYEHLYNTDIERFVRECYTPDCEINGGDVRGHAGLLETERRVFAAAPRRRMRVERTHAVASVVVVEAVLLDPDQGPGGSFRSAPCSRSATGRSRRTGRMRSSGSGRDSARIRRPKAGQLPARSSVGEQARVGSP